MVFNYRKNNNKFYGSFTVESIFGTAPYIRQNNPDFFFISRIRSDTCQTGRYRMVFTFSKNDDFKTELRLVPEPVFQQLCHHSGPACWADYAPKHRESIFYAYQTPAQSTGKSQLFFLSFTPYYYIFETVGPDRSINKSVTVPVMKQVQ